MVVPGSFILIAAGHPITARMCLNLLTRSTVFFFFNLFFKIYLFLRQRQSTSRGGAEREGDTESEAGSRLRGISTEPDAGLEPTNREIMT